MPLADDDGLISGLTEEQLITNEEMDGLVKEVRVGWVDSGHGTREKSVPFFVSVSLLSREYWHTRRTTHVQRTAPAAALTHTRVRPNLTSFRITSQHTNLRPQSTNL